MLNFHLQKKVKETKAALELELQRTKGRMLTEVEHQNLIEKVEQVKQFEEINDNLKNEVQEMDKKYKMLVEKVFWTIM